jgi:hypothetical protein
LVHSATQERAQFLKLVICTTAAEVPFIQSKARCPGVDWERFSNYFDIAMAERDALFEIAQTAASLA